jgi:hypothetical protein
MRDTRWSQSRDCMTIACDVTVTLIHQVMDSMNYAKRTAHAFQSYVIDSNTTNR